MVIGVCGLGYTGSGAVVDLLKEYKDIQVQDGEEFTIAYRPDGLEDLAYHLNNPTRYMSCDAAIYRFKKFINKTFRPRANWGCNVSKQINELTDNYINTLTQVKWRGFWGFDIYNSSKIEYLLKWSICYRICKYYEKIFHKIYRGFLYREMHLSVLPENFYSITQEYVSNILSLLGYDDTGIVVLNQAFSGDNPQKSFKFFKNPKAICVDKDPRDLYLLCKEEVTLEATWTPTENVDDFINYYQIMRQNYSKIKNDNDVLLIRFEDLIYEYDKTVEVIERFIGISCKQHIKQKMYFNPDVSINNTQLFRKYPKYAKEISKIEEKLSQYLYPYDKYLPIEKFDKAF